MIVCPKCDKVIVKTKGRVNYKVCKKCQEKNK